MMRDHNKPHVLLAFSGMVWLIIGIFLNAKGLYQLVSLVVSPQKASFLSLRLLEFFGSGQKVVLAWTGLSLFLGLIKARLVLSRVVEKNVQHILFSQSPLSLRSIFNFRYLLFILLMMSLGRCLSWIGCPLDLRGALAVTVGTALIIGSFFYFRISLAVARRSS